MRSLMMAFFAACCLILVEKGICNNRVFPEDFKFGVSTAAYQIEGAWNADGKGENIWDHLLHTRPNFAKNQDNGDVACNSYNLWTRDVEILKELGVDFYRFSISWSRLLPMGTSNFVNPQAVSYYNSLIDGLLEIGVEPMVTTYHGDLPQRLQDFGGWTNALMVDYYHQYADVLFRTFGDRVKKWITFNEPVQVCAYGYGFATEAPAINLSGIADYQCGRNLLLSHAAAYRLYEKTYKKEQNGQVGITVNAVWSEPKTNQTEDVEAAERNMQMDFGWWTNPIFSPEGDYPTIMKERIARISLAENYAESRLPPFTQEEINLLKGSADFLGLNHYSTRLVSNEEYPSDSPTSHSKDLGVLLEQDPQWPSSSLDWLKVVPWGFRKTLQWIKNAYNNPLVYVTENGFVDRGGLNDQGRINYYKLYLDALLEAIHVDQCNVKAYSAWSLMDNLEWAEGFTAKFGLYNVNFTDPSRPRVPKASSHFYKQVINSRTTDTISAINIP